MAKFNLKTKQVFKGRKKIKQEKGNVVYFPKLMTIYVTLLFISNANEIKWDA